MTDTLRKLARASTPGLPRLTVEARQALRTAIMGRPEAKALALLLEWHDKYLPVIKAKDAEITALRAKVKAQAEALKPFAELAQHFTNAPDDGWIWRGEEPLEITVGDLRRAAQEAGNE